MERSALSHLKRAPSMNIHRGSLHALAPSHLTAFRHPICGGSRRSLFFWPDAEVATSLAKPLWIGCKSSTSGSIPAQPEPNGPTPPRSFPLDMILVEAFRQPPEVTAHPAAKLEIWPEEGYTATKFDPTVGRNFFNREDELKYIKKLVRLDCPENVILLLGPRSCGKTALIEELMKENPERFLHLNCGLKPVTTSAEMAQALRGRASKLPAALGIALRNIPVASKSSWVSQLISWVSAPWGNTMQVDKDALAAASKVYDQISDLMSESKANNLKYVTDKYTDVLVEATPGKEPVFIIDEVNKLKEWRKTPAEETNLKNLLDFLRRICKEQNKAHVFFGHL
ncbi:hypothetical protein KSW81_001558 [Nannochloris sp. 'desiccata']|nr:hypothetical protein KSW81_001558 [Chlorella desiccata (nom. nud.)]